MYNNSKKMSRIISINELLKQYVIFHTNQHVTIIQEIHLFVCEM